MAADGTAADVENSTEDSQLSDHLEEKDESEENKTDQVTAQELTKVAATPVESNMQGEEEEEPFAFADYDDEEVPAESSKKMKKAKLIKIPNTILNLVGAAMREFDMIKEGDRVMVALSGGKDSLALVHILRHFQSVAPIRFELGAITVDPMVVEY